MTPDRTVVEQLTDGVGEVHPAPPRSICLPPFLRPCVRVCDSARRPVCLWDWIIWAPDAIHRCTLMYPTRTVANCLINATCPVTCTPPSLSSSLSLSFSLSLFDSLLLYASGKRRNGSKGDCRRMISRRMRIRGRRRRSRKRRVG